MSINWFPGHMHKAHKEIAELIPSLDLIIEVLDARIPFSSENPMVPALRADTACIKLLNKADLADPAGLEVWVQELERQQGIRAIPVSQQQPEAIRQLLTLLPQLLPERNFERNAARVLILGAPNVGKSTLINTLVGRRLAKTGNEAGITKSQQRILLDNGMFLTDTPGFLWPKLNPPSCGYRLALTGAIKETAFDFAEVALFAAEYLLQAYPERLQTRYRLSELPETDLELLDAIARQRGCLRKQAGVDYDKVARLFISEIRSGELGPLCFETPDMVQHEQQQAAVRDAEKAAEKAEHDRLRRLKTRKNRR